MNNLSTLFRTDAYKQFHMMGYAPGTNKVSSYACARSDKEFKECIFFGLQYYLDEYLSKPITHKDVVGFLSYRERILGPTPLEVEKKLYALADLGYWPVKIKAIPEGTLVPTKNALFTIENTDNRFFWCVGYLESLLLKVWFPTLVATRVLGYRRVLDDMFEKTATCDQSLRDWYVCDFGFRSDSSDESSAIAGAAHLIHFKGSDTIPALPFIDRYYGGNTGVIMGSVAASEHSIASSYSKENEFEYFERMLNLVPEGIVSIVSDTFDYWKVLTEYIPRLKNKILNRNGKTVIRPDSGYPLYILCGDPNADPLSPQGKGTIRLLDDLFGHTINEKGYKVLDSHISCIYGEGITLDRYKEILETLAKMGYASNNLVIGVGGILRSGNRDTLGFALKATYVEVNGEPREIFKDPVTGKDKKSHKGLMVVDRDENGIIITRDQVSAAEASGGLLVPVFQDGEILKRYTFNEVRKNALGI